MFPARMDYYYTGIGSSGQGFGTVSVNGSQFTFCIYKTGTAAPAWCQVFTKGTAPSTPTPGAPTATRTQTRTPTATFTVIPPIASATATVIPPTATWTPLPTFTFTPAPATNTPPAAPFLDVPVPLPIFDWTDVPGATCYYVEVYKQSWWNRRLLVTALVVKSEYRPTIDIPAGAYSWQVRAGDDFGHKGEWARYWLFTIR
jgi:hypothetical protein